MRKTKDAVVKMTDRLNPEAFLAAKDAGREAFQANKDWHDITTAMLSAYDKSLTAYLAALTEPDSTLITDELTRVAEALHGDDCPDDHEPGEACTCDGDTYYRMAEVALEAAALPTPRTITNMEELGALPGETVIKAADGNVYEQNTLDPRLSAQWVATGSKYPVVPECVELPATVLWVSTEGGGE